jgi:hypothetical protein
MCRPNEDLLAKLSRPNIFHPNVFRPKVAEPEEYVKHQTSRRVNIGERWQLLTIVFLRHFSQYW